jgi:hypothetical protein
VAAEAVTAATLGWLLAVAVDAAAFRVGPWISSAANELAKGYRLADARTPIAQAIADRFGTELHRGFDANVQEWWISYTPGDSSYWQPCFKSLNQVYGPGQFTKRGLWTVSEPPPEIHADLAGAWELETGPISRWRLPVNPQARIAELHRPQHWASLVTTYPKPAAGGEGWELPGVNQRPTELTGLVSLPTQRAARTSMRRHLVPDWTRLAADYDGVHLSWAGFITSEGYVNDLGDGDVAMLRYWFSERTHWVTDAFGEPEPLGSPSFDLNPDAVAFIGVDPRTDAERREHDQAILDTVLDRQLGTS